MIKTIIIGLLFQLSSAFGQDSLFTKAILDESTEPYYVLVTVVNDSTKTNQTVCTEAPFLLGAIHLEQNIPYSDSGSKVVQSIALSNSRRIFHFKHGIAINNIPVNYDSRRLAEVRTILASFSEKELREQLSKTDSKLHTIYNNYTWTLYKSYRDATAHVLLEKGISVRLGCRAGYLVSD
jgi:hypothetical protein